MWYNRAADLGNPGGMVSLGWLYEYGKGVETDACQGGHVVPAGCRSRQRLRHDGPRAAVRQGKGVQRDDEPAAIALNRKAASLGNSMAMNNLAWMLQSGRGVERRDPEEAADLMMKALDRRNEFSRQRMTQHSDSWSREFRQALQSQAARRRLLHRTDRRPLPRAHHRRHRRLLQPHSLSDDPGRRHASSSCSLRVRRAARVADGARPAGRYALRHRVESGRARCRDQSGGDRQALRPAAGD